MRFLPYTLIILLLAAAGCAHRSPTPDYKNTAYNKQNQSPRDQIIESRILSHYKNWQGVQHRMGGNTRSGIDCSAYTQRVYNDLFSIKIPRTSKQQKRSGLKVATNTIKTGDLLFFNPRLFSGHVGIYLGDNTFVHVSSSKGVTRSRIDKGYWRKHFHSARRVIR